MCVRPINDFSIWVHICGQLFPILSRCSRENTQIWINYTKWQSDRRPRTLLYLSYLHTYIGVAVRAQPNAHFHWINCHIAIDSGCSSQSSPRRNLNVINASSHNIALLSIKIHTPCRDLVRYAFEMRSRALARTHHKNLVQCASNKNDTYANYVENWSERYSIVGRIRSINVFHLLLEMQ